MEPTGVSGTVTTDQRSYIKIKTLHGKNLTEIHSSLSEFVVSSHWAVVRFHVVLIVFVVVGCA